MSKVTVVIPNYNGIEFMDKCLDKLTGQSCSDFDVIVVDNGSTDGSADIAASYENIIDIKVIRLSENFGFPRAVNEGIKASQSEYVILLNNDAYAEPDFISELVKKIDSDDRIFSAQALMLQYYDKDKVDSIGDCFSSMGWAFSKGKDRPAKLYDSDREIFSACAGAAIYRREAFDSLGYFDEAFFAYLEDMDIGYRARLNGYVNVLAVNAVVYHVGSGSSGSRHNAFKVKLSSRNSFLVMYKNFAGWQRVVNAPLVGMGYLIKVIFFARKKLAKDYISGVREYRIYRKCVTKTIAKDKRYYRKIQSELFKNCFKRLFK